MLYQYIRRKLFFFLNLLATLKKVNLLEKFAFRNVGIISF